MHTHGLQKADLLDPGSTDREDDSTLKLWAHHGQNLAVPRHVDLMPGRIHVHPERARQLIWKVMVLDHPIDIVEMTFESACIRLQRGRNIAGVTKNESPEE